MRLVFTLVGAAKTKRKIRYFSHEGSKIYDPVLWKWAERVRTRLRSTKYPPRRPTQTYQRTGNLANRWAKIRTAPGAIMIANRSEYSGWVIGRSSQAWMHAGRWWVADDIVEDEARALPDELKAAYVNTWRSS